MFLEPRNPINRLIKLRLINDSAFSNLFKWFLWLCGVFRQAPPINLKSLNPIIAFLPSSFRAARSQHLELFPLIKLFTFSRNGNRWRSALIINYLRAKTLFDSRNGTSGPTQAEFVSCHNNISAKSNPESTLFAFL